MLSITARRALIAASRSRVPVRSFSAAVRVCKEESKDVAPGVAMKLSEVKSKWDLFGPGAKEGTIPTDIEQATGLERLELLGKLEGIDIFDQKPLDSSRIGTVAEPIVVDSLTHERYIGCSGSPADSHEVEWALLRHDVIERCPECGSVYKMNYLGPPVTDGHHH
ncbi:COX5B-domain-containing protein [Dipodascopsis tothii]|uniref:COX5B-domain-containing protein n=1 Tax=Dipodascopsis tothii TaxID=44089 RepID=UPI0034CEDBC8